MKNINLVKYGWFTRHIHDTMKNCVTPEKLDEVKETLSQELKRNAKLNIINADEFTRLRFRLTAEYIGRLVEL